MGVRLKQCSCLHLQASSNMAPCGKAVLLLLLVEGGLGARTLRGNAARDQRSLVNTFPFNSNEGVDGHHGHHGEGHHDARNPSVQLEARAQRQGDDTDVSFPAVAAAGPGADGKRCIDKVEMIEETEYDDVVQCDHSYDRRCHTTYVTQYESQQEEECEENFRKNCFIDYEKVAFNETVEICRTPIKTNCDIKGTPRCRTEYETECWTKHEKHDVEDDVVSCTTVKDKKCEPRTSGYTTEVICKEWPREVCTKETKTVTKYTPITGCDKIPTEVCAPDGCKFVPGEPHCYDKTQTIVQDAPKEECSLEPHRTCGHVTKLVPHLKPKEECTDVPKEVCTRSRVPKPDKVKRPVVKKWCYVPTEESGLPIFD